MSHAILPEDRESPTLGTMARGERAYTTPWAMWVDSERRCWLHPGYPAESRPHGTVSMRVDFAYDGYHVWMPAGETWSPVERPGYASPADTEYLPVVALHRA